MYCSLGSQNCYVIALVFKDSQTIIFRVTKAAIYGNQTVTSKDDLYIPINALVKKRSYFPKYHSIQMTVSTGLSKSR